MQAGLVAAFGLVVFVWLAQCQGPGRCGFKPTDLPKKAKIDKRFTDFIADAKLHRALCLCVRRSREISFCEHLNICPSDRMVVSFQNLGCTGKIPPVDVLDPICKISVKMLGGYGRKYIAMGFTNEGGPKYDDEWIRDGETIANLMSSGAPAFMCGFDVAVPPPPGTPIPGPGTIASHFTIGYLSKSYAFQRYTVANDPNHRAGLIKPPPPGPPSPVTGLPVPVEMVELKDGLIECQFEIQERYVRKNIGVAEKLETKNPIDIALEHVYVVMAQGRIHYLKDAQPKCWVAKPEIHAAQDRHKSRYKFLLRRRDGGDQSESYHMCSSRQNARRPDYYDHCFAFGPDGCLGLTFDCSLFVGTKCNLCVFPTPPTTGPATGEFQIDIRGHRFEKYVAVGFALTEDNARDLRVSNLKYLITCVPKTVTPSYTPQIYNVDCSVATSSCKATKDVALSAALVGTRDDKFEIACNIRLPLANFDFLLKQKLTLFMIGSNTTAPDVGFDFEIHDREFPENSAFGPHNVELVYGTDNQLYRNDFLVQQSHGEDYKDLELILNLNPTRKTSTATKPLFNSDLILINLGYAIFVML